VGWDLDGLRLSWLRILYLTEVEELVVFCLVEVLCELVYSCDSELPSECLDHTAWFDFITGKIIVSDKVLTGLVHCEALG
jgi:hypothetical protein